MPWWKKIWSLPKASTVPDVVRRVHFTMGGWSEQEPDNDKRVWRGPHGSVLSLTALSSYGLIHSQSEDDLRNTARGLAAKQGGGLIEVNTVGCGTRTGVRLIYKRLQKPAYVYTGMFIIPVEDVSLVWTVVAGECGTTGVREAVVTAELFNEGKLDLQGYERFWAEDPYDKTYCGVDRSVLRFLSDDEEYDSRFPDHPLTRVRAFLTELCHSFKTRIQAGA